MLHILVVVMHGKPFSEAMPCYGTLWTKVAEPYPDGVAEVLARAVVYHCWPSSDAMVPVHEVSDSALARTLSTGQF